MKSKIKCLAAVLGATVLLSALVGCAQGVTQQAAGTVAQWAGITATVATSEDKAAFALREDSDCGACHEPELDSIADEKCLAGNPAHLEIACTECHAFDKDLQKAHDKIDAKSKPKDKLMKTSVSDESCLECHNLEDISAATPAEGFLVDLNGTAVNPHDVQALGGAHAEIVCTDCHAFHKESNVDEAADAFCLTCHHADVYECGTCH